MCATGRVANSCFILENILIKVLVYKEIENDMLTVKQSHNKFKTKKKYIKELPACRVIIKSSESEDNKIDGSGRYLVEINEGGLCSAADA